MTTQLSPQQLSKLEDKAKMNVNQSNIHLPLRPNAWSYDLYLCLCSWGMGEQLQLHKERVMEAEAKERGDDIDREDWSWKQYMTPNRSYCFIIQE